MTQLPRVTVNLDRDAKAKIDAMKQLPEFKNSASKVINYLVGKALEMESAKTTPAR